MLDDDDDGYDDDEYETEGSIVSDNTTIITPQLVPEVQLHLADEDLPLYRAGEDELAALGIGTPYWAFAWAGGQALARYVIDNPSSVAGRKVLDFGAGSGLVAIAAAMAGAFDVTAADIDPVAAEAMALNRGVNDVWFEVETDDVVGTSGDWEVLLVGDVFYDKDMAVRQLPWLRDQLALGRSILVGDPGRLYLRNMGLEPLAEYHAPTTGIMEDSDLRNAKVWRFTG